MVGDFCVTEIKSRTMIQRPDHRKRVISNRAVCEKLHIAKFDAVAPRTAAADFALIPDPLQSHKINLSRRFLLKLSCQFFDSNDFRGSRPKEILDYHIPGPINPCFPLFFRNIIWASRLE